MGSRRYRLNFENFRKEAWNFTEDIGLNKEHVHELEVADSDRAHYSKRTIDFEFDFKMLQVRILWTGYSGAAVGIKCPSFIK